MRQFICIFALFAVFVSCVKNDPMSSAGMQESQVAIAFDCPIMAAKVKSVVENRTYPDNLNFKVWGFFSDNSYPVVSNGTVKTPYIDGVEYTKSSKPAAGFMSEAGNLNMYGCLDFTASAE